jgi:vacuolar-type H+-ATPase subunit I/STV1
MAIIFVLLGSFGLWASSQKNPMQLKIFGLLFFIAGVSNLLFRFVTFSWKGTGDDAANRAGRGTSNYSSLNFAGADEIPFNKAVATSIIQMALSTGALALSYLLWK